MSHTLPPDAVVLLTVIFSIPALALVGVASWLSCRLALKFKRLPPDKKLWIERPWVIRPIAGVLTLYALCFSYGTLLEADWVQTTRTEIKVREPVLGYDRFR